MTALTLAVSRGVLATTGDRHDMFHFQGQVEHGFWRMAIFTTMLSPKRHLGIMRVHRPNASASASAQAADAGNSAAMSVSSSVCSSAGRVAPWSRAVRQRSINAISRSCWAAMKKPSGRRTLHNDERTRLVRR